MLAAELGSVRITWGAGMLKRCRGHREQQRLGTVRAQQRLSVEVQPSCSRDPSVGDASAWMTTKNSSSGGAEPAGAEKTSCVCCRGRSWRTDPSPSGKP